MRHVAFLQREWPSVLDDAARAEAAVHLRLGDIREAVRRGSALCKRLIEFGRSARREEVIRHSFYPLILIGAGGTGSQPRILSP